MTMIKRKYWVFYLEGREDRRMSPTSAESDVAQVILSKDEASLRGEIAAACAAAAKEHLTERVKKRWMSNHREKIDALGLDAEEAYQAWSYGKIDELSYAIESDVLESLEDECMDDDDD